MKLAEEANTVPATELPFWAKVRYTLYEVLAFNPSRKNCCLGRTPTPRVVIEMSAFAVVRRDGFDRKAQNELDRAEKM